MAKHDQRSKPGRRMPRRQRLFLVSAALVVGAVVVGYFAYRAVANLPASSSRISGTSTSRRRLAAHALQLDPPTSGPHLPYIAPWGVHTRPIQPELQVHNLEDGGVLVQYNCECPELVAKLSAIVRRYDKSVILAPYPR